MVIAALGVLDDVTVSQASTVLALRSANPSLRFRQLFRVAQRVGRDHVSATVNTLVLAYVGASLPVLLIFAPRTWASARRCRPRSSPRRWSPRWSARSG